MSRNQNGKKKLRPLKIGNVVFTTPFVSCPCNSRCYACKKPPLANKKLQRCSRCSVAFYCSRKCQKCDWKTHKRECRDIKSCKISEFRSKYNLGYCFYTHGSPKKGIKHLKRVCEIQETFITPLLTQNGNGQDFEHFMGLFFSLNITHMAKVYIGKTEMYFLRMAKIASTDKRWEEVEEKLKSIVYTTQELFSDVDSIPVVFHPFMKMMYNESVMEAYLAIAKLHLFLGKPNTEHYLTEGLKVCHEGIYHGKTKTSSERFIVRFYELMIVHVCMVTKDFSKGIKYALEGIELFKCIQKGEMFGGKKIVMRSWPYFHYYLAFMHAEKNMWEKARSDLKNAKKCFEHVVDKRHKYCGILLCNVSQVVFTGFSIINVDPYHNARKRKKKKGKNRETDEQRYKKELKLMGESIDALGGVDGLVSFVFAEKIMKYVKKMNEARGLKMEFFHNPMLDEIDIFYHNSGHQ